MAGCLPCFVLPLLLFIFHRFIQPLILKFWNPWAKKDDDKKSTEDEKCELSGGKCVTCVKFSNFWNFWTKKEDKLNSTEDDKYELIGDKCGRGVLKPASDETCCLRKISK